MHECHKHFVRCFGETSRTLPCPPLTLPSSHPSLFRQPVGVRTANRGGGAGGMQNVGNSIGVSPLFSLLPAAKFYRVTLSQDVPSVKLHAPPGGASSICFGAEPAPAPVRVTCPPLSHRLFHAFEKRCLLDPGFLVPGCACPHSAGVPATLASPYPAAGSCLPAAAAGCSYIPAAGCYADFPLRWWWRWCSHCPACTFPGWLPERRQHHRRHPERQASRSSGWCQLHFLRVRQWGGQ